MSLRVGAAMVAGLLLVASTPVVDTAVPTGVPADEQAISAGLEITAEANADADNPAQISQALQLRYQQIMDVPAANRPLQGDFEIIYAI